MEQRNSTGTRRFRRWIPVLVSLAATLLVAGVLAGTGLGRAGAGGVAAPAAPRAGAPAVAAVVPATGPRAAAGPAAVREGGAGGPTSGPGSTASAPGSAAYRSIRAAWDAGDLTEQHPTGTVWRGVRVAGQERRYLLSVPPAAGASAPLVIVFHGLDQRAGAFASAYGLVPATRAAGQVLVLPESSGPAFNDGRLGAAGPDDDAFALAVVGQLAAAGTADPHRVVVAGFSNGAGMAMSVAARHPGRVAALVSIDGALMAQAGAPRPTGPVRAYLVHGTDDPVQPWGGRPSRGPTWPAYISQPATVAQWVQAAGGGTERTTELGGRGSAQVTEHAWAGGPGGAAVTSYAVHGMAHVWPRAGRHTIDATALVVDAGRRTATTG